MIEPKDFIENYRGKYKPQLIVQSATEIDKKNSLRTFLNIIKRLILFIVPNPNDSEIEKAWKEIKLQHGEINSDTINKYLFSKFCKDHLRKFEYTFLVKCLEKLNLKNGLIVDMGGGYSYSTIIPVLLNIPKARIISIDVIKSQRQSKYAVSYQVGNCIKTGLSNGSCDVVLLISTLEHVGLGRYGDPIDPDGDFKAVEEARRILKRDGHLIITVPYGYPTVVYNLHRIYDSERIKKIIRGFKKIITEYSLLGIKCRQKDVEGKKALKNIKGYYQDELSSKKIYNPQGGMMGLFQKK